MGLFDGLDEARQRALLNIREAAARIWARPLHRYYTDHTMDHSERIITALDGLTAVMMDTGKCLIPDEVFILLAAAYLHDIGMQNERFAGGDLDTIRSHHSEQTAEMIYAVFEDPANAFPIPLGGNASLIEAVALAARGHREPIDGPEYDSFVLGGSLVRTRLLAALLRLGDALDADHRRVDLETMKLLALPLMSQMHWWRCHFVGGVRIEDETVHIGYRFPESCPDYREIIIPLVEKEIRNELAAHEALLRENGIKTALAPPEIRSLRLLQPMPPEVETLARREAGLGGDPVPHGDSGGSGSPAAKGEAAAVPGQSTAGSTFNQSGQVIIGDQFNIETVNMEPSSVSYHFEIGEATGLAIGNGARVELGRSEKPPENSPNRAMRDTSMIRDLLNAAFSDDELTSLCFDHFPAVYDQFSAGMLKSQKIQALLEYCVRHDELPRLLDLIRGANPAQYARYCGE